MRSRLFSSKINLAKSSLAVSVEWDDCPAELVEKQIIATHVASFLDLYKDFTESDLGLAPGLSKKAWLTNMIKGELEEVKHGKLHLAIACIDDRVVGFIICEPVKARREDLKNDVYISLLAANPFRDFKSEEKIHIGIGRHLMESAEKRFSEMNTLTLDTRLINKAAIKFYEKLGFNSTGRRTFGGSNPDHYVGYEKANLSTVFRP